MASRVAAPTQDTGYGPLFGPAGVGQLNTVGRVSCRSKFLCALSGLLMRGARPYAVSVSWRHTAAIRKKHKQRRYALSIPDHGGSRCPPLSSASYLLRHPARH